MDESLLYLVAADALLVSHALFVCFVVIGLLLIFVGKWLGWRWVRHPGFRIVHLLAIAIVVLQSWLGMICPLTAWEMNLRATAGDAVYAGSFVSHWLERLLYYHAPEWVFVVVYTLFGALVVASWRWVRPER
ncbi:MAG: DUF2784 domain-containing protein [Gammaproteobacteria bacterium]|nr:DUF2784 domain-containing protein [Gammaproteobacteria bacterium]MDH3534411.1 DUF2784 domain-containing protein [Gammaproteobacteria bacterium]